MEGLVFLRLCFFVLLLCVRYTRSLDRIIIVLSFVTRWFTADSGLIDCPGGIYGTREGVGRKLLGSYMYCPGPNEKLRGRRSDPSSGVGTLE